MFQCDTEKQTIMCNIRIQWFSPLNAITSYCNNCIKYVLRCAVFATMNFLCGRIFCHFRLVDGVWLSTYHISSVPLLFSPALSIVNLWIQKTKIK